MQLISSVVVLLGLMVAEAAAGECGAGTQSINRIVTAKKEVQLRKAPNKSADKIINQKATEVLHRTQYAVIDESTKVNEVCRKAEWSYIEVVEPEWLRGSHRGWVPTSSLNVILKSASGKRVYRETEIGWMKDTKPYKKELLFAINGFIQDRCSNLDPYSLARSTTKGSKEDPVFFIACDAGTSRARNIFFSKSEIQRKMAEN